MICFLFRKEWITSLVYFSRNSHIKTGYRAKNVLLNWVRIATKIMLIIKINDSIIFCKLILIFDYYLEGWHETVGRACDSL